MSAYVDTEFEAMLASLAIENLGRPTSPEPTVMFRTPDGEAVYLNLDEGERFAARIVELVQEAKRST